MRFNGATQGIIYQLYHDVPNTGGASLFKKKLLSKYVFTTFGKGTKDFINSNFEWESNEEMDLTKFNDISLLNLLKSQGGIDSMFNFRTKCGGSEINAFGLIKIWVKIMQEDEQLKGDLNNALKKDYVFPLNPENMQRHIDEVEEEISNNPLARTLLS